MIREDRDSSLQTDQWVLAKLIGRACQPHPRKEPVEVLRC